MVKQVDGILKGVDKQVKKATANWKAETPRNVRIAQWLTGIAGGISIVASGAQEIAQADFTMHPTISTVVGWTAILAPITSLLLQFVAKKIR